MRNSLLIKRSLDLRSGSEGPHHDPYGYDEITVTQAWRRPDGFVIESEVVLHSGLVTWLKVNGKTVNEDETAITKVFTMFTGMSTDEAIEYHQRARFRCQCGNAKRFRAVDGYPGETLYVCNDCQAIVTGDFDRSVIE